MPSGSRPRPGMIGRELGRGGRAVLDFGVARDDGGQEILEVPVSGVPLLDCPTFNKGSAFSEAERDAFGLHGLLPPHTGTIDEQLDRRYNDFSQRRTPLQQHVYLRDLQDRNEVLFYRLIRDHIAEMMPLIYTPVVGEACQQFSHIYRKPRGLFISYDRREDIGEVLANRPFREVDVIVVTDGERILGLGDLGVGGMGIPVGKLSLYTLCGGIHPARTLPIFLDVGTDNPEELNDPLYLGYRNRRVRGDAYDEFIESFVQAVQKAMPGVLLQWEDFALANARRLLDRYRDRLCTFNDDIQGTAAVSVAAILVAAKVNRSKLADQRVVILGAGSAGSGIADGIAGAMVEDGLTEPLAQSRIWMVDRPGLLIQGTPDLQPFQARFARTPTEVQGWRREPEGGGIPLEEVIDRVRPTVLIGASGQPSTFTESAIRDMARHIARPAILPLSNPTSRCEATPADLLAWTDGRALVATGSPFDPVPIDGRTIHISQCNNAYIFPGMGLAVVASKARRVSDGMFLAAARALARCSPVLEDADAGLFPPWERIGQVSRRIAEAVGTQAQREGLADPTTPEALAAAVDSAWWEPGYRPMRRKQGAR